MGTESSNLNKAIEKEKCHWRSGLARDIYAAVILSCAFA